MAKNKNSNKLELIMSNRFLYDQIDYEFKSINIAGNYKMKDGIKLFKILLKDFGKILNHFTKELKDASNEHLNSLKSKDLYIVYIYSDRYEFQIGSRSTSIIIKRGK